MRAAGHHDERHRAAEPSHPVSVSAESTCSGNHRQRAQAAAPLSATMQRRARVDNWNALQLRVPQVRPVLQGEASDKMNHRGHRSSLALVLAPFFELSGAGAEHTLYAVLHRACTPRHLTTNGAPVSILELTAVTPTQQQQLRLVGVADAFTLSSFEQYRIEHHVELPAGTELRLRVRDASMPSDRSWKLQRRWPFASRRYPTFQAALVVLIP